MDDMAAWIARAVYYQKPTDDPVLDRVIADRMDELRGCSGTQPGTPSGA